MFVPHGPQPLPQRPTNGFYSQKRAFPMVGVGRVARHYWVTTIPLSITRKYYPDGFPGLPDCLNGRLGHDYQWLRCRLSRP
jgi:hypothetical protein